MRTARTLIALLIATAGVTAAIATDGSETPSLPDRFTFEQPELGQGFTYHFQRTGPDGTVSDAMLYGTIELRAQETTLDAARKPVDVMLLAVSEADYVDPESGTRTYREHDTQTQLPWRLLPPTLYAQAGADRTAWIGSHETVNTVGNATFQGITVPGQETSSSTTEARLYPREGSILRDCLSLTMPSEATLEGAVGPETMCFLDSRWLDPAHPEFTTGQKLGTDRLTWGGYGLPWALTPVEAVETDHGPGVRFQASFDIHVVYAEGIPFPVEVILPRDGGSDRIFLSSFTQKAVQPSHARPALPPELSWTAPRPWGLDDTGSNMAFPPSAAWQLALDDPQQALPDFLAKHRNAFTEIAQNSMTYIPQTDGHEERPRWQFVVRGGDARLGITVTAGSDHPIYSQLPEGAPTVASFEPLIQDQVDLTEAPTRLPTLASLAAQYTHATGRAPAYWHLRPGCDAWVQAYCEPDEIGQRVTVFDAIQETSRDVDLDSPGLRTHARSEHGTMSWYPDGMTRSVSDARTRADYTIGTATPVAQEAAPKAEAIVPEPGLPTSARVAIGGSAVLAAILVYFWPSIKTATLGLFSRIHGEQSLSHPVRARLAQAIAAEPGVHFQDLVRAAGAGRGATEHHLRKLVETGQVLRHDAGGYVCFFPKRTDRHVMAAAPALRSETARQALRLIIEQPGIHGAQLAKALGINRGTLSHHVKRLTDAGVLAQEKEGRAMAYHATEVGRKVAASGLAA